MLSIGAYTYGNPILRGNHNNVTIGKYGSFGENTLIDSGFSHNYKNVSTYPFQANMAGCSHLPLNLKIKGDVVIGNDFWCGEQCVIMSGVTIGDGAIIGMRGIVTKDVKPYEIIVGNHRSIGFRFNPEQIEKLLQIKWWDWLDEKVRANAHLLLSENIDNFINLHYK